MLGRKGVQCLDQFFTLGHLGLLKNGLRYSSSADESIFSINTKVFAKERIGLGSFFIQRCNRQQSSSSKDIKSFRDFHCLGLQNTAACDDWRSISSIVSVSFSMIFLVSNRVFVGGLAL